MNGRRYRSWHLMVNKSNVCLLSIEKLIKGTLTDKYWYFLQVIDLLPLYTLGTILSTLMLVKATKSVLVICFMFSFTYFIGTVACKRFWLCIWTNNICKETWNGVSKGSWPLRWRAPDSGRDTVIRPTGINHVCLHFTAVSFNGPSACISPWTKLSSGHVSFYFTAIPWLYVGS